MGQGVLWAWWFRPSFSEFAVPCPSQFRFGTGPSSRDVRCCDQLQVDLFGVGAHLVLESASDRSASLLHCAVSCRQPHAGRNHHCGMDGAVCEGPRPSLHAFLLFLCAKEDEWLIDWKLLVHEARQTCQQETSTFDSCTRGWLSF